MNPLKIAIGFAPLFVFSALAHAVPVGWAATAGAVAALAVVAATAHGGIKVVPAVQAGILLLMAVVGFTGGWFVDSVLEVYGQGIVGTLLGLFVVGTAATMPFTAQFARSEVPPALWHDPRFLAVNRRISTAWGLAILAMGLCHLVAATLYTAGAAVPVWVTVAWVLPLVALVAATRYTTRTVAAAHRVQERNAS